MKTDWFKKSRKFTSLIRAVVLCVTMLQVRNNAASAADITVISDAIVNPGFESDVWGTGAGWEFGCDWNNVTLDWQAYGDNTYITGGAGDYCFKFWVKDTSASGQSITLDQTVTSLPAGVYTLSGKVMGAGVSVYFSAGFR